MKRLVLAALCSLLLAAVVGVGGAEPAAAAPKRPVVAILDTGVSPTHESVGFKSPPSKSGRVVAWWDFTATKAPLHPPAPGEIWDPQVPVPYDDTGLGTAAASLIPEADIAVGRVCRRTICDGNMTSAIRWAVDTVRADVITVLVGYTSPFPAQLVYIDEAIAYARAHGVIVVTTNDPSGSATDPTDLNPIADKRDSLVVGSLSPDAMPAPHPEVVVSAGVTAASLACDTCYDVVSPHAFTPLVSGNAVGAQAADVAARVIAQRRSLGLATHAADVERLVKHAATDTVWPPSHDGYGVIDAAAAERAVSSSASGIVARPEPDAAALYVESSGNARDGWTRGADTEGLKHAVGVLPDPADQAIGVSSQPGVAEGEVRTLALSAGDAVAANLIPLPSTGVSAEFDDIDLYFVHGNGEVFSGDSILASSTAFGATPEALVVRAPSSGVYTVAVMGSHVTSPVSFALLVTVQPAAKKSAPVASAGAITSRTYVVTY